MSFIYPTTPVVGQDYTINGKSLRYNGIGFIPSPQTSDQAPDVLTEILPTDYIGGRRSVTGAEWTFETLRNNIFTSGCASTIFVSTADEFAAAIGMDHSIIEICVTKPITVNPFSNVYADYVYITGCEITLPDGVVLCNKTSTNTTTNYLINNALLYDVTDPDASVIVVTVIGGMTWECNITVREFKTTRPLGVLVTTGCQLNLITGKPLTLDAQQLVGSYTATVDATLDLGQEDTSGLYLNQVSLQGKHTVTTEITNAGFFTVSVLMELNDGDSGTTVLMQQDNGILLHPNFVSLTYLDSIETGTTAIKPEIYFPRFDGEAESITIYGMDSATKGTRTLYKVSDGSGGWSYEYGNECAVILENGNWYFTYKTVNSSSTNTTYYSMVISGHADLYHSIL